MLISRMSRWAVVRIVARRPKGRRQAKRPDPTGWQSKSHPGGALRVRPREVVGIWSSFHRYLSIVGAGSTAGGALDSGSGVGIAGAGGRSTVSMLIILALGGALGRSLVGSRGAVLTKATGRRSSSWRAFLAERSRRIS